MFDHVTIRVSDRAASESFYDTVLPAVDLAKTAADEWDEFSLAQAIDDEPVTRRLHVAFFARSQAQVDDFWRTGTQAGFRDDGAPGLRPQYSPDYYGSFLLDPDSNSVEAVHHTGVRKPGSIDHLWIRVADVQAAKRFYETIAPHAGFRLSHERPERVHFGNETGSFGLVSGVPTEHVHIAFPVGENGAVDAFHRAAVAAGYRDNGGPGERSVYHAGYYGAYVLDPDGNNVELVNHNRR